jgi:hypothetical protein
VSQGEYTGRQLFHDIWLTKTAMPFAKRDLGKIGVTELEQLDQPLPRGIRCRVQVALRKDDNGKEYNRVTRFDVVAIEPPKPDAFAPLVDDYEESGNDGN